MRRFWNILLWSIILATLFVFTTYGNEINVAKEKEAIILYIDSPKGYVGDQEVYIDEENINVAPLINDGRTLVPLRFIAEKFNAQVQWNKTEERITINKEGKEVVFRINKLEMKVNNQMIPLDVAAVVMNGRTLVPLRPLAEALDKELYYKNGLIIIGSRDHIDQEKEREYLKWLSFYTKSKKPPVHLKVEPVFEYGDWIFYNSEGNLRNGFSRIRKDGSENVRLFEEEEAGFIFGVREEWMYFTGDREIFRMKINGSQRETLRETYASEEYLDNQWIFYLDGSHRLNRMNYDGSENIILHEDAEFYIGDHNSRSLLTTDHIYLIKVRYPEAPMLYRIKKDGTEMTPITTIRFSYPRSFYKIDDWIIYQDEDYRLYKIKTDGSNKTLLENQKYANLIGVNNDTIYYLIDHMLHSIKVNGTQHKFYGIEAWRIFFRQNKIYLFNSDDIHKMNLDGTERKRIYTFQQGYHGGVPRIDEHYIYFDKYKSDRLVGRYSVKLDGTAETKME